ncbi:MAG: nucleotide sugar dehydrogenase [Candidatus Micrarchaeota archaeon]|nr:nucleotide sugar dehydrogenase [Candidatus Micrarchaeota archaeon]
MNDRVTGNMTIVVIGLGYVGLPLAVKFAEHYKIIGYDINKKRVTDLNEGRDWNNDVTNEQLKKIENNITFTTDENEIGKGNIIIISVPTPLKPNNDPDLSYVESASRVVGKHIKKGAIVVYESTVYPGCTEEFCLPILEKESKMKLGEFYIGFSPERMNPGDSAHSVDKIVKLISASHPEALEKMRIIYSKITKTHSMSSIMAAESAKIIENVQRDINIALFNELSMLFDKLGLDSSEVFDGAATKWNFIRYKPGLVGGYCIPVNPHYLAYKAHKIGFNPEFILAGRKTNDRMPIFIASKAKQLAPNGRVLIIGASYKENVAELRSSRIKNLVEALQQEGFINMQIYEPLVSDQEVFGLKNETPSGKFDLIIYAVAHETLKDIQLEHLLEKNGAIIDIQRKLDRKKFDKIRYWAP